MVVNFQRRLFFFIQISWVKAEKFLWSHPGLVGGFFSPIVCLSLRISPSLVWGLNGKVLVLYLTLFEPMSYSLSHFCVINLDCLFFNKSFHGSPRTVYTQLLKFSIFSFSILMISFHFSYVIKRMFITFYPASLGILLQWVLRLSSLPYCWKGKLVFLNRLYKAIVYCQFK